MTLYQFYQEVTNRVNKTGERYGQATYNHLWSINKELADHICIAGLDPFYIEDYSSSKWKEFTEYLESIWYVEKEY